MSFLVLKAYILLVYFDPSFSREDFAGMHDRVRSFPVRQIKPPDARIERICSAVDMASIWYWKQALCLQRSAATACLLRCCGFPAQLVIGAQQVPFRAHAWVEVDDRVVNDKPYMREMYAVLDRC